jgi:hypothetical protein
MQDLSLEMAKAVRRFEPIETEGLTLYPIQVKDIDEFTTARPAIEFMQQSLPVAMLSKPLLQAYYTLELDAAKNGQPGSGLFYKCILFLLLAMRVGNGLPSEKRIELVDLELQANDPTRLKSVLIFANGEVKRITPMQFQRLRPILAAQNGIELVSENANPELVQAERDLAEMNAPKLQYRVETLKATIATFSGADEADMEEWPILKLLLRRDAVQRLAGYITCSFAEAQGGKWKHGNPFPSPLYDREIDYCGGLIDMSTFAGGAGMRAVQNAGNQTT